VVISAYQRSASFEKAYLTDLFQEMTDLGTAVQCVTIERGWKEIDTVEDYDKAVKALKTLEE
jgi:NDP-sugar pyrophosphorylase family protein